MATDRLPVQAQSIKEAYDAPANFLEIEVINPQVKNDGKSRYVDYEVTMRIVVPPMPGKSIARYLPFRADDGLFDESFIERRRKGLEEFINKVAGHPLAQNQKCLTMFLLHDHIDRDYKQ